MKNNIILKILKTSLLVLFLVAVYSLSIRGLFGTPKGYQLIENAWMDNGPLELSPERGRYALLYSIVEDKSVFFSLPVARFATPDLGYINGNYVSLFAPTLSIISIPGYIVGKYFNLAQVGAFSIVSIFAIATFFLIRIISKRIGISETASTLAGLAFLFGTPAFAYSVSLYQHLISTFLILFCIYLLIRFNNFWSLFVVWFLVMLSVTVDYPNAFMMIPVVVFALSKFFELTKTKETISVKVYTIRFLSVTAAIIPLVLFLMFNNLSYGNPFQLSGGVERVEVIGQDGKPFEYKKETEEVEIKESFDAEKQNIIKFFSTRGLLLGFYQYFISEDRGIIFYTPVMLFSVLGVVIAMQKKMKYASILLAVIGFNVLLYSMWGDPYGGWAFGSRYLIPSYAIAAIFIAFLIDNYKKYILFLLLFCVVSSFSIAVNTLGAITSSRNPPKVEAVYLENISGKKEHYTFLRNVEYLNHGLVKAFTYQTYAKKYLSSQQYYFLVYGLAISPNILITIYLLKRRLSHEKN